MGKEEIISKEQYERYLRNILQPGVGLEGQEKLFRAGVLVVGTGGLGSPVAFYLTAAGIGRIGLIDGDAVSLSNLQRQILHSTADLGRPKVLSAGEKLKALNPDLKLETYQELLEEKNAEGIIKKYDFIIDCTDNFPSRYIINKVCIKLNKPFVYGGVLTWFGQAFTIIPGKGPCLRCAFRKEPPPGAPTLSEMGVMGVVPGIIGLIQAAEAIRFILDIGELLVGRILTYDALSARFYEIPLKRDEGCPDCGTGTGIIGVK